MLFRLKKSAVQISHVSRQTTSRIWISQSEDYDFVKRTALRQGEWSGVTELNLEKRFKLRRKKSRRTSSRWRISQPLKARALFRKHYLEMRKAAESCLGNRRID